MRRALGIIACCLIALPALADVRVVDGDTLALDGERIRLHGIDAPESGQECNGADVGEAATNHLRSLITAPIHCLGHERDRYGRLIAVCYSGRVNLNAEMVRSGHAWAYLKYSHAYAHLQQPTACEPPWEFRKRG